MLHETLLKVPHVIFVYWMSGVQDYCAVLADLASLCVCAGIYYYTVIQVSVLQLEINLRVATCTCNSSTANCLCRVVLKINSIKI